jgi:sensor histidine kinase YesM
MSQNSLSQILFREQFKQQLGSALKTVLILIAVTSAISVVLNSEFVWEDIKDWAFYCTYYGFVLSLVNGMVIDGLDYYYPWEQNATKRAVYGVLGQIVFSLLTIFILNIILWVFIYGYDWSTVWRPSNRGFYLVALIITVIISLTFHSIYFFKEVQAEKKKSERLEKEKTESELSNLRAHMDPHFLFNSLNVASGLIDEDKEKAQDFVSALSSLYRNILEKQGQTLSTVREELDIAQSYIGLYKSRFEDAIHYEVEVDLADQEALLPSMSLQLLIENAIKHNAFDKEHPLEIKIFTEEGHIVIWNTKRRKELIENSTRKSLKNIRSRYTLLGKDTFSVEDQTDAFTVKLPLIREAGT